MSPSVSIIVPACNAASTLTETVASVRAQTHRAWELILVENGSTDSTAALAAELAAEDSRIRAVSSPIKGVSSARNEGLALARFDWVLFLDADDWILPTHLQTLTDLLAADPSLDAVHCGWRRVSPDRVVMFEERGSDDSDLFPLLSRTCPFAIHTCVCRRTLVQEVGGFDPSLRTCEDWDLWQRLARSGARFAACPEILAVYLARPQSASMDGRQMLADGFKVIARAFAADARVPRPLAVYAGGRPPDTLPAARLDNLIWQAGLVVGSGGDAAPLLSAVANDPAVSVDSVAAASSLLEALLLPTARPPEAWWRLHGSIAPRLELFLGALETHTRQPGLARSMLVHLERRAVAPATVPRPITVGGTHAIALELSGPFRDLALPGAVERLHCRLEFEREFLGELELPVCDGLVPADVLADAIAAEFAWTILGRFFARSIYPQLTTKRDAEGWTIRRGAEVLARGVEGTEGVSWTDVHDRIGWALFVQEAWALKTTPTTEFYLMPGAERRASPPPGARLYPEWLVVDLLDPLQDWRLNNPHVDLVLTVAGVPVACTPLIVPKRVLSAGTVRAATMHESRFELCRVCVREALLQQPLTGGGSLRERLAATRARRPKPTLGPALLETEFMPGAAALLPRMADCHREIVLWPRHADAACSTSASRRAVLPRAAWPELQRLTENGGKRLVGLAGSGDSGRTVLYAPELVWRRSAPHSLPAGRSSAAPTAPGPDPRYFEELFRTGDDPWNYTSPYEQTKYQQTLDLLPRPRFRSALELACAEGHFTVQLAPRVDRLLATDVADIALERTRRRCASHPHVRFERLDLVYEPLPPGRFDLIVCSEVLYYTGSRAALAVVADKLAASLAEGGYLVCAHAHLRADDPTQPGFDWDLPFGARTISEVFGAVSSLRLTEELRTPLYRIQLFRREERWRRWLGRRAPRVSAINQPVPLPPDVAECAVWTSTPATPQTKAEFTEQLPILMYHRIATGGPAALAPYRVSPNQFEAQLQYLAEHRYQSVTLDEWRDVAETKRPLPGRRVLLTFDDACSDFSTSAWPLLNQYGFGALVFVPTDEVGGNCRWDARFGEPAPLMSWSDLQTLGKAGIEFGSHTASHPMLTGLSPEAVAREALRSRAALEERLGTAVLSMAYPFGASDRVVETIIGACGYRFGLTCETRCCTVDDRLLALPRLEVSGTLDRDEFAALLVPE